MAEPFKNMLGEGPIRAMAGHLSRVAPGFDGEGFIAHATHGLDALELKQRSTRITDALETFLPDDFSAATDILLASLAPDTGFAIGDMDAGVTEHGILGWPVLPLADYVARHGQDHIGHSLDVLKQMTTRASSEFAIRPFLHHHPQTTLNALETWTGDENEHVRRLVSEGTRPRLPWGMRLTRFVADPAPVLDLLHRLRDDPSEYVRRSVANNLNDIAKDHPDRVADIAKAWIKDATVERNRLVRHALRSLIKSGHPGALKALGYGPPKVELRHFAVTTPEVTLGGALEFEVGIASTTRSGSPVTGTLLPPGPVSPLAFPQINTLNPNASCWCG